MVPFELGTANTLYGRIALSMVSKARNKWQTEGGTKSLILEAVTNCVGYIWYIFFGKPNNLNALNKSFIVSNILTTDLVVDPYTVNGMQRDWLYFLVNGICVPY
jgi:hypothetical protein